MITLLTLLLAARAGGDTVPVVVATRPPAADTVVASAPAPAGDPLALRAPGPVASPMAATLRGGAAGTDTIPIRPRPRAKAVEYSDWYARRLFIHRWASYTMLPLFAFQYAAGRQLLQKSSDAPEWARTGHRVAATATAGVFGLNTLTGVWNLVDGRHDPSGRKWRTTHSILMLLADGGFTATGLLANPAETSAATRRLHEQIAIGSMATASVAFLMMIPPFRRE